MINQDFLACAGVTVPPVMKVTTWLHGGVKTIIPRHPENQAQGRDFSGRHR